MAILIHVDDPADPRLDDFRALRATYDPRGAITSDLARRLALV